MKFHTLALAALLAAPEQTNAFVPLRLGSRFQVHYGRPTAEKNAYDTFPYPEDTPPGKNLGMVPWRPGWDYDGDYDFRREQLLRELEAAEQRKEELWFAAHRNLEEDRSFQAQVTGVTTEGTTNNVHLGKKFGGQDQQKKNAFGPLLGGVAALGMAAFAALNRDQGPPNRDPVPPNQGSISGYEQIAKSDLLAQASPKEDEINLPYLQQRIREAEAKAKEFRFETLQTEQLNQRLEYEIALAEAPEAPALLDRLKFEESQMGFEAAKAEQLVQRAEIQVAQAQQAEEQAARTEKKLLDQKIAVEKEAIQAKLDAEKYAAEQTEIERIQAQQRAVAEAQALEALKAAEQTVGLATSPEATIRAQKAIAEAKAKQASILANSALEEAKAAERQAAEMEKAATAAQQATVAEQVRLEALRQAQAAKVAAHKETENAKVQYEKEAKEAARIKAEYESLTAARIKAENNAVETARVEAENEASEIARVKVEKEAAAAAKEAAEAAKIRAEKETADATNIMEFAEAARIKAEQAVAEANGFKQNAEIAAIKVEEEAVDVTRMKAEKAVAEAARVQAEKEATDAARIKSEQAIAAKEAAEASRILAEKKAEGAPMSKTQLQATGEMRLNKAEKDVEKAERLKSEKKAAEAALLKASDARKKALNGLPTDDSMQSKFSTYINRMVYQGVEPVKAPEKTGISTIFNDRAPILAGLAVSGVAILTAAFASTQESSNSSSTDGSTTKGSRSSLGFPGTSPSPGGTLGGIANSTFGNGEKVEIPKSTIKSTIMIKPPAKSVPPQPSSSVSGKPNQTAQGTYMNALSGTGDVALRKPAAASGTQNASSNPKNVQGSPPWYYSGTSSQKKTAASEGSSGPQNLSGAAFGRTSTGPTKSSTSQSRTESFAPFRVAKSSTPAGSTSQASSSSFAPYGGSSSPPAKAASPASAQSPPNSFAPFDSSPWKRSATVSTRPGTSQSRTSSDPNLVSSPPQRSAPPTSQRTSNSFSPFGGSNYKETSSSPVAPSGRGGSSQAYLPQTPSTTTRNNAFNPSSAPNPLTPRVDAAAAGFSGGPPGKFSPTVKKSFAPFGSKNRNETKKSGAGGSYLDALN